MASDEQIDRLVRAFELGIQVLSGGLGAIEDAIREVHGKQPPPASRPSAGKQKVAR